MIDQPKNNILNQLNEVLVSRLDADQESSYVASLYSQGLDSILKKIAEEAAETIMAAKDGEAEQIVYEVADLWFHSMVLLAQQGIDTQQVIDELGRRMGTSGITEKLERAK